MPIALCAKSAMKRKRICLERTKRRKISSRKRRSGLMGLIAFKSCVGLTSVLISLQRHIFLGESARIQPAFSVVSDFSLIDAIDQAW